MKKRVPYTKQLKRIVIHSFETLAALTPVNKILVLLDSLGVRVRFPPEEQSTKDEVILCLKPYYK